MQLRKLAIAFSLTLAAATGLQTGMFAANRYDFIAQNTGLQATKPQATQFKVRLENISAWNGQTATNGTKWTLDFSPGMWAVHNGNGPIFTAGQKDWGQGLEALAEDGDPSGLANSVPKQKGVTSTGVFNTAVGASKVGGIRPGQAFEFTVTATPGQKLSLTTMFGQSNDWFYAFRDGGIALFSSQGKPIRGEVTSQILLWDAGTEVDQEPGIGSEQGPRQKAKNTGKAENGVVHVVKSQYSYPATKAVMRVTITPVK